MTSVMGGGANLGILLGLGNVGCTSCLDKSALLYNFSHSSFILDVSASAAEYYMRKHTVESFFFVTQRQPNSL